MLETAATLRGMGSDPLLLGLVLGRSSRVPVGTGLCPPRRADHLESHRDALVRRLRAGAGRDVSRHPGPLLPAECQQAESQLGLTELPLTHEDSIVSYSNTAARAQNGPMQMGEDFSSTLS